MKSRSDKKSSFRQKLLYVAVAACFSSQPAYANPVGAQVVRGSANISQQGSVMTVVNTPGTIVNWQNFSIGTGETTRFIQQSASSAILNRVVGVDPSSILGNLTSNGRVYLINPNGILFGAGSRIDTAGFVASTLNLSDQDFINGRDNFSAGAIAGKISNQGNISTPSGGSVYLVAPDIENSGIITSPNGEIILAAGKTVELVDTANPSLRVKYTAPEGQAVNMGQIIAEGGKAGIYAGLISQRGTVSASSAVAQGGKIYFKATQAATLEAGSQTTANGNAGGSVTVQSMTGDTIIDNASVGASGTAGNGGNVQLLGNHVGLTGTTRVDASGKTGGGTVLVGGDYQGKNAAVQNASMTYFGQDASLNASATDNGDGGKVIVWADDTTRAYGNITSKGGANEGDGGFVETSGHRYLDVAGIRVNTSASSGNYGLWLLDPSDITITHSPTNPVTPFGGTFNPGGATGTVSDFDINLNLNGGTDVLIRTSAGTGGAGNIVINGTADGGGAVTIQNSSGGARTLTLDADGGINMHIGASINGTSGNPLSVDLSAAGGNILIDGSIVSEGGDITLTTTGAGHNITTTGLDSRRNDALANSGNVTVDASGNVDISSIQANGMSSFSGNGFNGGNVDITGNTVLLSTIDAIGGDAYAGGAFNGGSAGNVTLRARDNPGAGYPLTFSSILATGGTGGTFPGASGLGGTVSIRADAIDQVAADIQAPFVFIRPNSDRNISLGVASLWCSGSAACDLELAAGLLDVIDIKKLTIGDTSLAGNITLAGDVNLKPASGGMEISLLTSASGKIDDGGNSFNNVSVVNFPLISLLASSGSVWLNGGSHDFDAITGNAKASAAAGNIGDFRINLFNTYYNQTVVADNAGRIPGLTGGIEAQGNVTISTVETLRVDAPVKALGGGIALNGDTSVEINNDTQNIFGRVEALAGSVTISSLGNIEFSGEAKSATGGVYATSTNGSIFINNFNGDGIFNGSILAAAPDPAIDSTNAIKLDAAHVVINHTSGFAAPPIPLGTAIVNATSGDVAMPLPGAVIVTLGSDDNVDIGNQFSPYEGGNSGVSMAELGEINAPNGFITIGNSLSDTIVDASITAAGKNLRLIGKSILQANGQLFVNQSSNLVSLGTGNIVANSLELNTANGTADFTGSGNQVNLLSGTTSSDFSYWQAANLTIGQQTTGIVAGGNVDVRSTAGKLNVLQSVDAGNTNLSGKILLAGATGVDASSLPLNGFITAGQFGNLDILATNDGGTTLTAGNVLLGGAGGHAYSGGGVRIATNGNVTIVGNVTMDGYGGSIFAGGTLSAAGNIVSNGSVIMGQGPQQYGIELSAGGNIALGGNITNNHSALTDIRIASTGGNIDLNTSGAATTIKSTRPGTAYLLASSGLIASTNQQVELDTQALVAKAANGITLKTKDLELLATANSTSGNISIKDTFSADNNPLAVTTIGADTGVTSVGNVVITSDRAVQLDSIISAGGSIDVVSKRFDNFASSGALTAGGGWHVWSTNADPFNVTTGDGQGGLLYNFKQYNATYGVTPVLGTGNGFLYSFAPIINPTLTGTTSKVYDGTNIATLTPANYTFAGIAGGDTIIAGVPTSTTYIDKNVGAGKQVDVTGISFTATNGTATVYGYQLSSANLSANIGTITPASLTLNAVTDSKTYDGTTASAGALGIAGLMTGDTITGATQVFNSKNVAGAGLSTLGVAAGYTVNDGNGGLNYTITSNTAPGTITPAALTVAATSTSRPYDGTSNATVTLGDNRFSGDLLTLSFGSAGFADKNIGVGKTVSINGITLSGTDAGNYTLASTTGSATADITVRPVSTWIGGASGVWSAAANWDALPDLSNVQAVSIPTGVNVTYDLTAATNLQNLTSAGSLAVGSGTLNVGNLLSTAGYSQTGGAVNAGSFVASNSFSQTGGTLSVGTTATITQTSGNLLLGNFSAGNATLTAASGSITGSGLQLAGISANASGNINLTNVGNLNIATMQSSGGNIVIDNTGGVVTGAQTVTASNGSVQFVAHSPITIGSGGISAGGNIGLTAGATAPSNIVVGGTLQSSTGNIGLTAANNITQNANIATGGSGGISFAAGNSILQNANLTTTGGPINLTATSGSITMAAGTATNSGGGAISYSANQNIVLATVNAGTGNVSLASTNGSLTSQTGGSITGSGVSLTAKTGIKLTTNAKSLLVTNTGPAGTVLITDGATGTIISDTPAEEEEKEEIASDAALSEVNDIVPGSNEDSTDLGLPGTDDQTIGKKKENEEENGTTSTSDEKEEKKSDKKNAC